MSLHYTINFYFLLSLIQNDKQSVNGCLEIRYMIDENHGLPNTSHQNYLQTHLALSHCILLPRYLGAHLSEFQQLLLVSEKHLRLLSTAEEAYQDL
jgi:hypothetical protein